MDARKISSVTDNKKKKELPFLQLRQINESVLDIKEISAQEGVLKLYDGDRYVGESFYLSGHLKIQIDQPLENLKLRGAIDLHSFSIDVADSLHIEDEIKTKHICAIHCKNLVSTKTITSQNVVNLNVSGSVSLQGKVIASDIDIIGDDISLQEKIHTEHLNIYSKNGLILQKDIRVKNECHLQAKKISNQKSIAGARVILDATSEIRNFGVIKGSRVLKIRAAEFRDEGKLYCRNKINIQAKKVIIAKKAQIHAAYRSKLIIEDLDNQGQLKLQGLTFFTVNTLQSTGEISLPDQTYFCSKKVNLKENAKFGWFSSLPKPPAMTDTTPSEKLRIVKIGDAFTIDDGSELSLSQAEFVTQELNINGLFDANYSVISANNFHVNGLSRLTASKAIVAKGLTADKSGKVKLRDAYVETNVVQTKAQSKLSSKRSSIHSGLFKTAGSTKLMQSVLTSKFVRQAGENKFSQSRIAIEQRFLQEKKSKLDLDSSQIVAAAIKVDGQVDVNEGTLLEANEVSVSGELKVNSGFLKAKKYAAETGSKTTSENGSQWAIDTNVRFKGQATFHDSSLKTDRLANDGTTVIKRSVIHAKTLLHGSGKLDVDGSEVKSNSLHIDGKHEISQSHLNSVLMRQSSEGTIKQSKIETKYLGTEKESHSQIVESDIKMDFGQFAGNLTFKHTLMSADVMTHDEGQLRLADSTQLTVSNISTTDKSTLSLDTSLLSGKHAGLDGKSVLNKSKLNFQSIQSNNHFASQNSDIKANTHLSLNASAALEHSQVQTDQFVVGGKVEINNKSAVKTKQSCILPEGSMLMTESGLIVEEKHVSFGETKLEKSQLSAEEIQIYHTLILSQRSQAVAAKDLSVTTSGRLKMNESCVQAENIILENSVQGKKSSLHARHDIDLKYGTRVRANGLSVQADNEIRVSDLSKIKGKSAAIKTNYLENCGRIQLSDGVLIDTEYLCNHLAVIDGGKSTHIEVNRNFTNFMSHVGGQNTYINASSMFNWLGDISGNDHLTINSLVNLNLFGTYRSYNANINSLIDLNAGLVLPTIPDTWSAVFSPQHGISLLRMLLTNALPGMSTAINFSFQATPLAVRAGRNIYSVITDEEKSWRDLLPDVLRRGEDWRNLKMKDLLPTILEVKSLAVSGYSLANSALNLQQEFTNFSFSKLKDDFSHIEPMSMLDTAAMALGPTLTRDSIFSCNMGIAASQNVTQSDFFSTSTGIQLGLQSLTHNSNFMYNGGVYAGNAVIMTGNRLDNNGIIANRENLHIGFNTINFGNESQVYVNNGTILGNTINQDGELHLTNSFVRAKKTFNLGESGHLDMEKSHIHGGNVDLHGTVHIVQADQPQTQADSQAMSSGNADSQASAGENKDTQQESAEKKEEENNTPSFESSIVADENVNIDGKLDITSTYVEGKNITVNGDAKVRQSYLRAEENFTQEELGKLQTEDVVVDSKHLKLAGSSVLTKTYMAAKEHVDITHTANIKAAETKIEGKILTMAGTASYTGYFGLIGNENITTTTTSHVVTDKKEGSNILEIRGQHGDIKGSASVDKVLLRISDLIDATELVVGKGTYEKFQVSDYLGLDTDVDLILNQSISRSCGLDLHAKSILFAADYDTQHDIRLSSKAGNVTIANNLSGINIYAEAKGGNLYTYRKISAKDQMVLLADGDYFNIGGTVMGDTVFCKAQNVTNIHRNSELFKQVAAGQQLGGDDGSISGRQVFLEATNGDIANYGGVLSGSQYLQGIASRDIINQCSVTTIQGKYDTEKRFDPAVISGGTGLDEQGLGLYLCSGGKVLNIGSTIASAGHNYIIAKQGFESTAVSHTYVSERKKRRKWYGKKETKTKTNTVVQSANVISTNGRNIIIAENGGVEAIATNFISAGGTDIHARNDIKLYSLKYADKKTKKTEHLWGLSKYKRTERHEDAVPVLIMDDGITRLESAEGSIFGRGVVAIGNGDFLTKASHGSVRFASDILSHDIDEKRQSLSASIPGSQIFTQKGYLKGVLASNFGLDKVQTLRNSQGAAEWVANGWNTGVAGYNAYQDFMQNFKLNNWGGGLLQMTGTAQLFQPTLDVSYTTSQTKTHYETAGPGLIQRRSWQIEAGEDVSILGMDVSLSGDMHVKAKIFDISGHELNSSMSYKEQGVKFGVTATGEFVHAGVNQTKFNNKTKQIHHQNTYVGGRLHLDVDDWNITGANVDTGTLTGEVRKELHITSLQDTYDSKMTAISADTSGEFSFHTSSERRAHITKASGIHVREGINHDEAHQFNVHTTISEGGKITSDGQNQFRTQVLINKEVKDYDKGRSFGISGNVQHLLGVVRKNPPSTDTGRVNTMNMQVGKRDFSAVQQATYHGQQGTNISYQTCLGEMNLENNDGRKILQDSSMNISLDIPLVNVRTIFSQQQDETKQETVATEDQTEATISEDVDEVSLDQPENNVEQETTEMLANEDTFSEASESAMPLDEEKEPEGVSAEEKDSNLLIETPEQNKKESDTLASEQEDSTQKTATLQDIALEMGLDGLEIGYEELDIFLAQCGEAGIAKIFKTLGVGVSFAAILIEEKKNGNEDALKTAFIRTAIEVPLSLPLRVAVPIKLLAKATEGFTASCEQTENVFLNKEVWEKYGHDEKFFAKHSELFTKEGVMEAYGLAKALQLFTKLPSTISKHFASKIINNSKPNLSPNMFNFFYPEIKTPDVAVPKKEQQSDKKVTP